MRFAYGVTLDLRTKFETKTASTPTNAGARPNWFKPTTASVRPLPAKTFSSTSG
jgi:hypothetical protein